MAMQEQGSIPQAKVPVVGGHQILWGITEHAKPWRFDPSKNEIAVELELTFKTGQTLCGRGDLEPCLSDLFRFMWSSSTSMSVGLSDCRRLAANDEADPAGYGELEIQGKLGPEANWPLTRSNLA
jgi:hypothetical protein